GSLEAYMNEERQFNATAIYSNGKNDDWTKAVNWAVSPAGVVDIDTSGKTKMKAAGECVITARIKQPVKGVPSEYLIKVRVLGAPPKTKVKLPGPSRLTWDVVAALAKNLVTLSDPRFMDSNKPVKPGKPSPTREASVDSLLALTAEVVTK